MSPRQWLALLAFYVCYLFFGASVFYTLQQEYETQTRADALQSRIDINEYLVDNFATDNKTKQHDILDKVSDYCGKPVTNYTEDEYIDPYVWTFYHSFFFSLTTLSTVGYGNISPSTTLGRIFMIFYAIVGLPVNLITLAGLGEFFGNTFHRLYERYKQYKKKYNANYVAYKLGLIAQIILYLVPGILIFIFLPACVFTYFEDWPYSVSVYYAFVTLTTIGFGDFAATFQPQLERQFGVYFICYEVFVIFWVMFGLGYIVMLLGFLVKGLQTKRMKQLEHQLSMNIKQTQQKIWNGVTSDVGFLRKILNEINMLRFKPVYNESMDKITYNNLPRSESCPDLSIYRSLSPLTKQKRAMSDSLHNKLENISSTLSTLSLNRTHSDTDLDRIDRKKTFEGINAVVQPGELLARVVTALGNFRPPDKESGHSVMDLHGGVHGFSDSQILASERTWSGWSLQNSDRGYDTPPNISRERASSEIKIPVHDNFNDKYEWTWSGSNLHIKDLLRQRQKALKHKDDLYRASFGASSPEITINMPPETLQPPVSATNKSILNRFNIFRRRNTLTSSKRPSIASTDMDPSRYMENTAKGRYSKVSLPKQYLSDTPERRPSADYGMYRKAQIDTELLERTTIADLIRALEMIHTRANYSSDVASEMPKRKKGTASLTPPRLNSVLSLFEGSHPTNNFDRRPSNIYGRKQSTLPNIKDKNNLRKPPPYSFLDSPNPIRRRFSVRPSALNIPPGQAPPVNSQSVQPPIQKKISIRPSPLARENSTHSSGRARSIAVRLHQEELMNKFRSTSHGSLTNLYKEKNDQSDQK